MLYPPISSALFVENRARLATLLEGNSLALVNTNDVLPTNADGTFPLRPSSDLLYLTGIAQEESILLLFPKAHDPRDREILFIRDVTPIMEIWEGRKLNKEAAAEISGMPRVEWLSSFSTIFRTLMCEAEVVYLNQNEHPRAVISTVSREARFVAETRQAYPLHQYRRLARLLHALRPVKSAAELELTRQAIAITYAGFERVARFTRPGVNEMEVEAEFAHEFIRRGGAFAYQPIIGSGLNATALHYNANSARCEDGDLLLLDVASSYAHYNADLTRTIPVNGRFSPRQRQVYDAVLRAFRAAANLLRPGLRPLEWRRAAEEIIEKELVDLGLLTLTEVREQGLDKPALKRYYAHGIGHPIGLDVHDVQVPHEAMQAGWVMTCEPGIYIPEEKLGVRLENMILLTENGPLDLMAHIPIEADDIEALMADRSAT